MSYVVVLVLHSLLRWAVLFLGLWAVLRAITGVLGPRQWNPSDERSGKWFVISLDVQTLLGLALYGVLSPLTRTAFADMAGAMRESALRFWAVEHVAVMLLAVGLAHVGRSRARKSRMDPAKHKQALIFYGLAVLALVAGIPWPWMGQARPLFRFG